METCRQNFPLWDFPYGIFHMGISLWEFPDFEHFGLISEARIRIRPKPQISQDLPRWSKTCVSVGKNHQISTFWRLLPTPPHERSFWHVQKGQILIHFSEFHENRVLRTEMRVSREMRGSPIPPMGFSLWEFPRLRWADPMTELLHVGKRPSALVMHVQSSNTPRKPPHLPPAVFNCGDQFPPAPAAQRAPAAR